MTVYNENGVSEPDTGSIERIASLARKYESNGDPACVSSGVGDTGGISYGLYQLSSNVGSVDEFVAWLTEYPKPEYANYGKLLSMNKVNSKEFIADWKNIGYVDPGGFGMLQDEYIKEMYYAKASKMLCKENYCADKHTDAMRAVILSRAVQNGVSGCVSVMKNAVSFIDKGKNWNLSYVDDKAFDGDMIRAIYDFLIDECDSATLHGDVICRSFYGFCKGSASVIYGLRSRFVREKADALSMLGGANNDA
ncbi:MAG: hypothetical protein IKN12_00790 [Selenomonadaceae bacterium]|nr:hypothetical protein [Selenomonadaceae bacterium]